MDVWTHVLLLALLLPGCSANVLGKVTADNEIHGVCSDLGTIDILTLPNRNDWAKPDLVQKRTSIGIKGYDYGGAHGILASFDDGTVTNEQWKCTSVEPPQTWCEVTFDDSSWADAEIKTYLTDNVNVDGISTEAKWIWAAGTVSGTVWCRFAVTCPAETVHNGELSKTGLVAADEIADVTCNEGFALAGDATFSCGTDGVWGTKPVCEPVTCPVPTIENGEATNKEPVAVAEELTVHCNDGFEIDGVVGTCGSDGKFGTLPSCSRDRVLPESCKMPRFEHGQTKEDVVMAGGTTDVLCDNGFQSNVTEVACSLEGKVSDVPQCLKLCNDPSCEGKSKDETMIICLIAAGAIVVLAVIVILIWVKKKKKRRAEQQI